MMLVAEPIVELNLGTEAIAEVYAQSDLLAQMIVAAQLELVTLASPLSSDYDMLLHPQASRV